MTLRPCIRALRFDTPRKCPPGPVIIKTSPERESVTPHVGHLFLPRSDNMGTFSSYLRPSVYHVTPSICALTSSANAELWGSVLAPPLSSWKVLSLKWRRGGRMGNET